MLKFTVKTEWWADGEGPFVGDVEISRPTKAMLRAAAVGHAAGDIEVTEGLEEGHVQSQEDGEAALAEAMGEWVEPSYGEDGVAVPGYWSGPWAKGNQLQHRLQQAQGALAFAKAADAADSDSETTEAVEAAEAELAQVEADIQGLAA